MTDQKSYAQKPLLHDVNASNFREPTARDLETPLAYLKWLDNVFRMYARSQLNWQDVRDTLKASPDIIAGFDNGSTTEVKKFSE